MVENNIIRAALSPEISEQLRQSVIKEIKKETEIRLRGRAVCNLAPIDADCMKLIIKSGDRNPNIQRFIFGSIDGSSDEEILTQEFTFHNLKNVENALIEISPYNDRSRLKVRRASTKELDSLLNNMRNSVDIETGLVPSDASLSEFVEES